ncbi:DUF952 domain-containing protein [Polycladidibacter stylochi]|uniref:DUF952 domain-containing protein n=1 Tax=Polycladidibacter stylochi TaxID=1807766 RepID=UPI0008321770|nr:DUF952 domain-containing protein [Pseudovibrio stylochi]
MALVYKITPRSLWHQAQSLGVFKGSPVDIEDGFIHFSTAETLMATLEKHFKGQTDLLLFAVEAGEFDKADLKWEPARGGELFPHLYTDLLLNKVLWVKPIDDLAHGTHQLPEIIS